VFATEIKRAPNEEHPPRLGWQDGTRNRQDRQEILRPDEFFEANQDAWEPPNTVPPGLAIVWPSSADIFSVLHLTWRKLSFSREGRDVAMGMFAAVGSVYANMFNFSGRARRAEYWWYFLFVIIMSFIAQGRWSSG
jgi:hypothetical protein